MKTNIALLAALLAASIPASAAHWLQLDKLGGQSYLVRQGDRDTLRRTGPWAEFSQRWLAYPMGVLSKEPPTQEVMAVNCLTGARSAKSYEHTDPETDARTLVTNGLSDIEQSSSPVARIDVVAPRDGLDAHLLAFACGCRAPKTPTPADEATLLKLYDTFIKEQTKEVGFHLRFMEFETKADANAALKMVESGQSFASVAERLNTRPDFPGGDLGVHPAHAWPVETAQVFNRMKPGAHTKEPVESAGGYSLYFMESRYEKPAAPFDDWRAAIAAYARREQSCGRRLF